MKGIKLAIIVCCLVVTVTSCKKTSSPNSETEHESINKVELRFSQNGTLVRTVVAEDPDGDGGNPPTRIDTIRLAANQTYAVTVAVKNLSNGAERDITPTIQSQGRSHEFFFLPTTVSLAVTKTDRDANNNPIGITSTWVAGAAAAGSLQLKLMHKPGIKGPNDAPNVGHSDIDIRFATILQ